MFVAFVHPDHDGRAITNFMYLLKSSGWVLSTTKCLFPDFGDSIIGTTSVIVGVHDSTQSCVEPMLFWVPPSPQPLPLAAFIWQPFNTWEYSVLFAIEDESFGTDANNGIQATVPSALVLSSLPTVLKPIYYLHTRDTDTASIAGAAVLLLDSLCPPFDGSPNTNMFCCQFGVEFNTEGHSHVRSFLPFEFTSCFGLMDSLCYRLSQHAYWHALDAGIPALTSAWIFDHILECLMAIRDSNTKIFPPNQFAAPATHIQAFTSGVIAT